MCGEKLTTRPIGPNQMGITPACAGKSTSFFLANALNRDHPRMCGEKHQPPMPPPKPSGSPPHVRGKGPTQALCPGRKGITPACAGKSGRLRGQRSVTRDHPRMCGEKSTKMAPMTACSGSPPHVRGKVMDNRLEFADFGITPACAGKSYNESLISKLFRDHPRMCGEKNNRPDAIGC